MSLQRRSPLRRGKPLQPNPDRTREWLERSRGGSSLRRSPMQPSKDRIRTRHPADYTEFLHNRDERLRLANGRCEVSAMLADASTNEDLSPAERERALTAARRCRGRAITAHHTLARGMGGHGDNSVEKLRATCGGCHDFVEAHPKIAEAAGLKVRHSR